MGVSFSPIGPCCCGCAFKAVAQNSASGATRSERVDFMTELRRTEEEACTSTGCTRGRLSRMPAGPMEGFEVLLICPKFSLGFSFGSGTPAQAGTNRMTYHFEDYSLDTER